MTNRRFIGYSVSAFLVVTAAFFWLSFHRLTVTTTATTAVDQSQVRIQTTDNISLAATIHYPVRNSLSPAVILLHEYGQDRHQWDSYTQKFLDAGFVVLSYDMRGFGESRLATIPVSQEEHLNALPNDVPAVLTYLRQQPAIDAKRISIIGASIGADVAFVASGSNLGIKKTVLISPVSSGTVLDGHTIKNFSPNTVLGVAADSDTANLNTFMQQVGDPKKTIIIPHGGYGVAALASTGVIESIITWLQS